MNALFHSIFNSHRPSSVCFFAVVLVAMLLATGANAQTVVRVDRTNGSPTPPNGGDGWGSDAFKYLQDALVHAAGLAQAGSVQVWVAAGTYKPDEFAANPPPCSGRACTFNLIENVAIYGGFAGNEPDTLTGFRSRDPVNNVTILSGEIGTANDMSDNSYHVVTAYEIKGDQFGGLIDGFT